MAFTDGFGGSIGRIAAVGRRHPLVRRASRAAYGHHVYRPLNQKARGIVGRIGGSPIDTGTLIDAMRGHLGKIFS